MIDWHGITERQRMSYQEDSIDWQAVRDIDEWLDSEAGPDYHAQPLAQDWARVGKVAEEAGEAVKALIGVTAQNPRKGVTHVQGDLLDELADAALASILAIQHFTKDSTSTRDILRSRQASVEKRIPRD